jgi:hypothetical protein
MMLMVVLFVMCLLMSQMNNSGYFYYTVDTAQFDYITVDEIMETISPNWRGLQEKDVSATTVAAYHSYFMKATRTLSVKLTDFTLFSSLFAFFRYSHLFSFSHKQG